MHEQDWESATAVEGVAAGLERQVCTYRGTAHRGHVGLGDATLHLDTQSAVSKPVCRRLGWTELPLVEAGEVIIEQRPLRASEGSQRRAAWMPSITNHKPEQWRGLGLNNVACGHDTRQLDRSQMRHELG